MDSQTMKSSRVASSASGREGGVGAERGTRGEDGVPFSPKATVSCRLPGAQGGLTSASASRERAPGKQISLPKKGNFLVWALWVGG